MFPEESNTPLILLTCGMCVFSRFPLCTCKRNAKCQVHCTSTFPLTSSVEKVKHSEGEGGNRSKW